MEGAASRLGVRYLGWEYGIPNGGIAPGLKVQYWECGYGPPIKGMDHGLGYSTQIGGTVPRLKVRHLDWVTVPPIWVQYQDGGMKPVSCIGGSTRVGQL